MAARLIFYSTQALNRSDEYSPESLARQRAEFEARGGKVEIVPHDLPAKTVDTLRSNNSINRNHKDED